MRGALVCALAALSALAARAANPDVAGEPGLPVLARAPVLMRAREADDLTRRASWTLAQSFCFTDVFDGNRNPQFPYVGIPWYKSFTEYPGGRPAGAARGYPVGWLETNVVQLQEPDQEWFDPSGRTFHLFMRANTSGSGYAALAKVVERADAALLAALDAGARHDAPRHDRLPKDRCIVSRSGDAAAKSPHDTDLITFHRVRDFRSLVY